MSYEQWKSIRDNVTADCEFILKAVQFVTGIPGAALSLQSEYNQLLRSDIKEIAEFIDSQGLWNGVNSKKVENDWLLMRDRDQDPFGQGLPGIGAKYATIQLLASKLDRIFVAERCYVDKTNHTLALLNRKLFLLEDFRERWFKAFQENSEPTLEKLGGLHLFEHGILAFKAKGPKEETDLILDENIAAGPSYGPLIMTEWKKAKGEADAETKILEARKQCKIYLGWIARPLIVKDHRFIIVVSETPLQIDKEFDEEGKRYLVRNIAIMRSKPSEEVRRRSRG